MALVYCGPRLYPDPSRLLAFASLSTNTNFQINGSGHRQATVFSVPASGTCTKVGMRIHTCASAVTSRLGLYTVDGSGNPTTTPYGSSNYGTFTPAATTYSEVTLGTAATMTAGNLAALVVEFDSTAGDMFISASNGAMNNSSIPYTAKYNGSAWSKQGNGQIILGHVYYSDAGGQYYDIGLGPFTSDVLTGNYNSTTAGADEYAVRITVPFKCRIAGIWHNYTNASGGDWDCVLYNGTTSLKSVSIDGDTVATPLGVRHCWFSSGYTCAAGTTVRAAVKPTTSTNVTYRNYPLFAANAEQSIGLPQGTCLSTRVDSGAWSDTVTTLPSIGLIIDQLDDGVTDYPDVGNVTTDDTVNGVTGTFAVPATTDVKSGTQYGAGGTEFTGTLSASSGGSCPVITAG